MKPQQIDFNVAYIATDAKARTQIVNEAVYNINDALEYLAQHDIELSDTTVYTFSDKQFFDIDEPVVPLTRKAHELIASMCKPVKWQLSIQRDPSCAPQPRGAYRTRIKHAAIKSIFTS